MPNSDSRSNPKGQDFRIKAGSGQRRPNILWICTDQQRYDTISCLGNNHIRTPNLDRLAAIGTAFTQAYCQSPICTPSRASFLTGMYPSSVHGCMNGNDRWSEAAPLVTGLLAESGYDCGLVGKLHLSGTAGKIEHRPSDDGYRVFEWSHSPRDRWARGMNQYVDWAKSKGAEFGGREDTLLNSTPELHQTTWCADRAIDFIESTGEAPWLLSVNIFDPHKPFDPPEEFLTRYNPEDLPDPLFRESDFASQKALSNVDFQTECRDPKRFKARELKAAYYAMIELIDENVGRMLDALESTGQRENTLVIFMSDHGEMLGDHGLLLKGCRFYDSLVRVPLILSWPGKIGRGTINSGLVELTDIAPALF
ncbi:MAG: sulfatase-like hydrolase/transferase, partial [Verrucomicrobia bacterium]|nr:sulfatase-like hydrolase/transferase [Verrucomicrobiota bacterium]